MEQYIIPNDKQIITKLFSISKPHTISSRLQLGVKIYQLLTV